MGLPRDDASHSAPHLTAHVDRHRGRGSKKKYTNLFQRELSMGNVSSYNVVIVVRAGQVIGRSGSGPRRGQMRSEVVKKPSRAKGGRVPSSARQAGPLPGPGFPSERRTVLLARRDATRNPSAVVFSQPLSGAARWAGGGSGFIADARTRNVPVRLCRSRCSDQQERGM